MRINSVSSVCYRPQSRKVVHQKPQEASGDVAFKAKLGQIVGGTVGAAAVVAVAALTAPVVVCLAGAGALVGAVGGDIAEDKINKDDKNK